MKFSPLLPLLGALSLASASLRSAQIYLQPITPPSLTASHPPQNLAEISYDPAALGSSSVVAYEAPELPDSTSSVRIGLYDPKSASWISGTTVASVQNFEKGYRPTVVVNVDAAGEVLSVAFKGVRIDAGQTRDFGPQVVVLGETRGKQPELNKPVVLSPEGKKVTPEVEKPLWQKYWWVGIAIIFLAAGGGGGDK